MIKSTLQGNLETYRDGLGLYYDLTNTNCYSAARNPEKIFSLARNGDFILPESGSTSSLYSASFGFDYAGYISCSYNQTNDSYIQCPGISDLSMSEYTIHFLIEPVSLYVPNSGDDITDSFIMLSDDDGGLSIKYSSAPDTIRFGIRAKVGDNYIYQTQMLEHGPVTPYTVTFDGVNRYKIYSGKDAYLEADIDASSWAQIPTLTYPFTLGYNFGEFKLYEFRIYNKQLTQDQIIIITEQYKRRFGNYIL